MLIGLMIGYATGVFGITFLIRIIGGYWFWERKE